MADAFATSEEVNTTSALDTLVGEGKKFATVEDLAKGKLASDEHVTKLEQEALERQAALETTTKEKGTEYTVADLMKAVKDATNTNKEGSEEMPRQMTPEELQEAIKSVMEGETAEQTRRSNREQGSALVLAKADGDVEVAQAMVAERAGKLGMTPAKLAELSEQSPSAFARLMELDAPTSTPSTTGLPKVNSQVNDPTARVMEIDGHKTKAFFDAERTRLGNAAFINDSGLQRQILKSAEALGARYNQ